MHSNRRVKEGRGRGGRGKEGGGARGEGFHPVHIFVDPVVTQHMYSDRREAEKEEDRKGEIREGQGEGQEEGREEGGEEGGTYGLWTKSSAHQCRLSSCPYFC
jgi:hypothetical protein